MTKKEQRKKKKIAENGKHTNGKIHKIKKAKEEEELSVSIRCEREPRKVQRERSFGDGVLGS